MKDITKNLEHVNGGLFGTTASQPGRRVSSSSSSSAQLQTALTGVTSALDSLKSNQNNSSLNQVLPVVLMAKWLRNNG